MKSRQVKINRMPSNVKVEFVLHKKQANHIVKDKGLALVMEKKKSKKKEATSSSKFKDKLIQFKK